MTLVTEVVYATFRCSFKWWWENLIKRKINAKGKLDLTDS